MKAVRAVYVTISSPDIFNSFLTGDRLLVSKKQLAMRFLWVSTLKSLFGLAVLTAATRLRTWRQLHGSGGRNRAATRPSHWGRPGLLAGLAAIFLLGPVACFAGAVGIVVPAYFYPGTGGAGGSGDGWAQIASAAWQVPTIAVFNPNSGPGPSPDPGYQSALNNLEAAGGRVVAYVYTNFGSTPIATVEGQMQTYISQYGSSINGFYLDGMSNLPANLAYYQTLYSYVKGLSSSYTVIGNPAAITTTSYFGTTDILNTFENTSAVFSTFSAPPYYASSSSQFSYTVVSSPTASTMVADVNQAVNSDYASYVYVTDQTLNPPAGYLYDQLPSYWNQEVSAVAAFDQTTPTPEPDYRVVVLLTTAGVAVVLRRRHSLAARV